ncbi:MAG: TonB family protein [Bacteroidales bacterium]|nr:TonB family protein [Bacteroidales bacterium]
MKRILRLCLLMLLCNAGIAGAQYRAAYSTLSDSETVAAMRRHVGFFAARSLEGRGAGSEGEKEAAVYLGEAFGKYGIDLVSPAEGELFGLRQESGDTLTSRNVVGFIPGYDRELKNHYIVIGARLDNLAPGTITVDGVVRDRIYPGANGNASGLAMLLELGRMLRTNFRLLRRSVLLVGFGSSSQNYAGAWYFLNRSFSDTANIDAMINLDMLGTGASGFYAYTSSNPDMNAIATALAGTLQPVLPELTSEEPYPSDHRAFYAAGIPSVYFTSGRYPEHNSERDTEGILQYEAMERELEYIYNYAVSLVNGPKPIFNAADELKKRGPESDNVVPYYDCDRRPTFLGSADPKVFLEKWVYKYLRYPEEAVRQGIQGRVLVDFIINERGKVTGAKVLRGVDPLLDEEALRVINASPDWRPGTVLGKKVKAEISMYVEFRLEKK